MGRYLVLHDAVINNNIDEVKQLMKKYCDDEHPYPDNIVFDENDPLGKITGHPPKALLPFKVHVVRLLDGKEVQVESIEGSPFTGEIDPSRYSNFIPEDRQSGIYYSFVYASNWPEGYLCLFRFVLKESENIRQESRQSRINPFLMA